MGRLSLLEWQPPAAFETVSDRSYLILAWLCMSGASLCGCVVERSLWLCSMTPSVNTDKLNTGHCERPELCHGSQLISTVSFFTSVMSWCNLWNDNVLCSFKYATFLGREPCTYGQQLDMISSAKALGFLYSRMMDFAVLALVWF